MNNVVYENGTVEPKAMTEFVSKHLLYPSTKLARTFINHVGGWNEFKLACAKIDDGIDGEHFKNLTTHSEIVDFYTNNKEELIALGEKSCMDEPVSDFVAYCEGALVDQGFTYEQVDAFLKDSAPYQSKNIPLLDPMIRVFALLLGVYIFTDYVVYRDSLT